MMLEPTIYKSGGTIYKLGEEENIDKVTIGDKDYPYVKIGNLFWTTYNLDWKYNAGVVGTKAFYYNNDESTNGWNGKKYGLLYNKSALVDVNSLLNDGWRVPLEADFNDLITAAGGTSSAGQKLKSKNDWAGGGVGTDEFGFNALPAGIRISGNFQDILVGTTFYSLTATWDGFYKTFEIVYNANWFHSNNTSAADFYSCRLCKDA